MATIETVDAAVAIVDAGGAGLRAAIAVAEADPGPHSTLLSKVHPMRSHTVAAEGAAAAVTQAHEELLRMENWGWPCTRTDDGRANVRACDGMKIERARFAADQTGFHMLWRHARDHPQHRACTPSSKPSRSRRGKQALATPSDALIRLALRGNVD